jgi:asparagine synthase (glutamine-hydrolysing)
MANSLEGRSPFLDHEFMELVASMPASLKMHGLQGKYILKKAFRGLLPEKILSRQKMGFGIPVDQWFRGELKDYLREIVLSERALKRGYFNREGLEHIIADHNDRRAENGYRLWALLMLELWHRAYID